MRTSQRPFADSIEAGRSWGREMVRQDTVEVAASEGPVLGSRAVPSAVAARRGVVSLLEKLGFAPSAAARCAVVKLRRCPLLEAAHQYPEVVCRVHLGIVRGVLDELGADSDRTENTGLQPFSEPGACRLDLPPPLSDSRSRA